MENGRILRIFRDGRKHERELHRQLPTGAQANLETIRVMKEIVQADSKETDLKNFVIREIIGSEKQNLSEQIEAAFDFCRDRIVFQGEEEGFETVADLWSCCYALNAAHPTGDCAIKSVALATCFSFLGLKPEFVALQQIKGADHFNHVYVAAAINGEKTPFDPTPPQFRIGDKLPGLRRLYYKIYV